MTTGQRIKAARKKAGVTQEELGKKLGVSPSFVAQYETGKRNPKIETLQNLANALGVPVYELIDSDDLKRAVIYGEGLDDDSSGGPPNVVLHEEPIDKTEVEVHELPAQELDALLEKLQDGEPLLLSPDELAKLKATSKEQVAAALDKLPSSIPAAHGAGHAFYCHPSLHPELEALFQKSQDGTITADELAQRDVLMAIVRNLEGYDPSQHEFFENLRNYRDAVGLSRNKLADKTGISAAKIRDYEDRSKVAFVTDSDLQKLAHFFCVDPIKFKGRSVTQEWMTDTHSQNCLRRVNDVWGKLNTLGHEKLAERAEELVEIPRYQAPEPPQDTPAPQEGKDTTPAEVPPEGPQEPPEGRIQSITMICPICGQHLMGDTKTGKAFCHYCKRSFPLPQILK